MNHEELRQELARLCPERVSKRHDIASSTWHYRRAQRGWHRCVEGDILEDLNAMHQLEQDLILGDQHREEEYWKNLYEATDETRWPFNATALHKAQAIVKTLRQEARE